MMHYRCRFSKVSMSSTYDTQIADDVLSQATNKRVIFCQAYVWEIPGNIVANPSQSLFFVNDPRVLNLSILTYARASFSALTPAPLPSLRDFLRALGEGKSSVRGLESPSP
jgi:hypothetical protein